MKKIIHVILLGSFCLLESCSSIIYSLAGMRNPEMMDSKAIQKYAGKFDLPENHSYYLDTTYIGFLKNSDSTRGSMKDHYQPTQALYFQDEKPYPEAWFINCRAYPKSFGVDWNRNGEFEKFLPAGNQKPDSLVTFDDIRQLLKPVHNNAAPVSNTDNTVLVFYCKMFHRTSRDLISEVKRNAKLSQSPVTIFYVNVDNYIVPLLPKE
jgi:hypothetical protein